MSDAEVNKKHYKKTNPKTKKETKKHPQKNQQKIQEKAPPTPQKRLFAKGFRRFPC